MATNNYFLPYNKYPGQYLPESSALSFNPGLGELLVSGIYEQGSTTKVIYRMSNGVDLVVQGTGFIYSAADGSFVNGTISSLTLLDRVGSGTIQNVAGLNWAAAEFSKTMASSNGFNTAGIILMGDDLLVGSSGADELWACAGNDTVRGGNGGDNYVGGRGSDTYIDAVGNVGIDQLNFEDAYWDKVGAAAVVVDIAAGTATDPWGSQETFSGIERIKATQFADTLLGSAGADEFRPLGGNDRVDGRGGVDTVRYDQDFEQGGIVGVVVDLAAGTGTDGYGGKDTLISVENVAGSDVADKLYGNAGVNKLTGGNGNDLLDGRQGADTMTGGTGNDIYYVDNSGDKVIEASGSGNGNDAIFFSASLGLSADAEVESLASSRKAGTVAINITGNGFAQNIGGNDGVNILNGQGGNDVIAGNGGNDRLFGSLGNDTLIGGTGNDLFFFDTRANGTANHDTIADFGNASGNNDTIYINHAVYTTLATGNLGGAFAANAAGVATQADDRIIYETDTGNLFYDVNGSVAGGSTLFATLTGHPAITVSDFVIY